MSFLFWPFFQSLSYADKKEITILKKISKNLTRGGSKIGDIEVDENLINLDKTLLIGALKF